MSEIKALNARPFGEIAMMRQLKRVCLGFALFTCMGEAALADEANAFWRWIGIRNSAGYHACPPHGYLPTAVTGELPFEAWRERPLQRIDPMSPWYNRLHTLESSPNGHRGLPPRRGKPILAPKGRPTIAKPEVLDQAPRRNEPSPEPNNPSQPDTKPEESMDSPSDSTPEAKVESHPFDLPELPPPDDESEIPPPMESARRRSSPWGWWSR